MKHIFKILFVLIILINAVALYRIGIDQMITFYEHFLIATFGAGLWSFGLFRIEKNKKDALNEKLDFTDYTQKNWDDWVWSFSFSLPIVWYMSDVIDLMSKIYQLPEYSAYYLGAGPLSMAFGYGINWVINKFK